MAPQPLRIATRGSRQALAQATAVADAISTSTGRTVELVTVATTGDLRSDVALHEIGGQGVFVKEVQRAVLDGRADLAAHSAKDLPSDQAAGLVIGAFCARRDARDAMIGRSLDDLAPGATVATGSVRRRAQLSRVRPDLEFVELRGNIDTRLGRIPDGGSIVMAIAALEILDLTDRIAQRLPVGEFVPAVGQGCVAVECRADDAGTGAILDEIDDATSRRAVEIERAFLGELGAGCTHPVGAHVSEATLHTFLADAGTGRVSHVTVELGRDRHDRDLALAQQVARDALAAVS